MDLDHVGDHLAAGEAEVDAVGTLTLAVADVGGKVPGAVAAGLGCALAGGVDQLVQKMCIRDSPYDVGYL